jgi:sugar phosphate isomerase/epimerase
MNSRWLPVLFGLLILAMASLHLTAEEPTVGTGTQFKGPVGLQLYSLRDSFKQDVPGTLDKVKSMGFRYVELAGTYGMTPAAFKQELDARGLVPVAGHFGYDQYKDDVDAVIRDARVLGLKYTGLAWIPHNGPMTEEKAREVIEVFNTAGQKLADAGLQFYYHNHGYEFQPHGDGTLMDLIIRETDPRNVTFQMDLLWTIHPGKDPAALLLKYPGRWQLMHLKDLRKGVKGDLSGGTDTRNDVVLGTGQADFPTILAAAKRSGVKWYFIEDESPTVEDQIPQSLKFLEQVAW